MRLLLLVSLLAVQIALRHAAAAGSGAALPARVALSWPVPASRLSGSVAPVAALAPQTPMRLAIGLARRDPAGFDAALRAIGDARDPRYHHYFSAAEVSALFGPNPAAVDAFRSWLASQGLRAAPWTGGTVLDVSGAARDVAAAFGVRLLRYPSASGLAQAQAVPPSAAPAGAAPAFAPDRAPSIPSAFSSLVTTVVGLQGVSTPVAQAMGHDLPRSRAARGLAGGYDPEEIAQAYDFTPLYAAGFHGEHTQAALVEFAPFDPIDVAAYMRHFGHATAIHTMTVDEGTTQRISNVEATLDVELLSAVAPGASINVYNAPNDTTGVGLLDAYSAVASDGNAQVLGLTWDTCEPVAMAIPGLVQAEHALFKQLALQGTTIVSATGDAGAYACSDPPPPRGSAPGLATRPTVSLPASDPYALAVGATDLTIRTGAGVSALGYETAWSCYAAQTTTCPTQGYKGHGSGGGSSTIFSRGDGFGDDLSWQTGPGLGGASAGAARKVPDVAISGSYGLSPEHEYSIYWQHKWTVGSGTSASAIVWAALVLLTDQYLEARGDPDAGWINPTIYQLGAAVQSYPAYHDIVLGDNLLYKAAPGWDFASGWGSPDAWNVVRDVAAYGTPGVAAPTLTPIFTATQSPSAIPTSTATASATPTATPIPVVPCPPTGLGNGSFTHGALSCWRGTGRPASHVVPAPRDPGSRVVQVGGGMGQRASSSLTQTFIVPGSDVKSGLRFELWYAHAVSLCGSSCRPRAPSIALTSPGLKNPATLVVAPARENAWFSVELPVPLCSIKARCAPYRLSLAITVPPQSPGVRVLLYVRKVYLTARMG